VFDGFGDQGVGGVGWSFPGSERRAYCGVGHVDHRVRDSMSLGGLSYPERCLQLANAGFELVLKSAVLVSECLGPWAVDEVAAAELQ
jgi:hypothetical protein